MDFDIFIPFNTFNTFKPISINRTITPYPIMAKYHSIRLSDPQVKWKAKEFAALEQMSLVDFIERAIRNEVIRLGGKFPKKKKEKKALPPEKEEEAPIKESSPDEIINPDFKR